MQTAKNEIQALTLAQYAQMAEEAAQMVIDEEQPKVSDSEYFIKVANFLWNNTRIDFHCDYEDDGEYVVRAVSFSGDRRDMSELFTAGQMRDFSAAVNRKFDQ